MAASNEAQIWGVMAASGSGKGVWVKGELKRLNPPRMVIWDYKNEYGEFAPKLTHSLSDVRAAMLKAGPSGGLRVRFKCKPGTNDKQTMREFEGLCRLVQAWEKCVFVAEELSNVTTPSWAPAAWREMTTGGRHEGVHIIGIAQNPALIDKTFLSNCTLIHVGPLRQYSHRQAVARSMDVPIEQVTSLVKFEYLERDFEAAETRRGFVKMPGVVPPVGAETTPEAGQTGTKTAPRGRGPRGTATGAAQPGQPAPNGGTTGTQRGGQSPAQPPNPLRRVRGK